MQERFQLLKLYLEQYIIKAGTAEGGAGSGSVQGLGARLRALLTGKRLAAAEITVQGIDDSLLQVITEHRCHDQYEQHSAWIQCALLSSAALRGVVHLQGSATSALIVQKHLWMICNHHESVCNCLVPLAADIMTPAVTKPWRSWHGISP